MGNNLLEKINRINLGDHIALLYEDKEEADKEHIIAEYIISRLNKNEKCFLISGDINIEIILEKIKKSVDLKVALEKGQLSILDSCDSYSKDGDFEPKKMVNMLKELTDEAINEGYLGLAITGEVSWALDFEDGFEKVMDYENMLKDEVFKVHPISALCRYNIDKFSSEMIKNIIEVHPIVIWNDIIHENPYYFDVVNPKDVDINKHKVDIMLKSISEYTSAKSRFKDKLKTAKQKYEKLQLDQLTNIIVTLTGLLEIHDEYTKTHSMNVAEVSKKIAIELDLSQEAINEVYYAGLVHDIGKAIISKEIINKNVKLTKEEYEIVMRHPQDAYSALEKTKELGPIANIVLQHHERWDGLGYPNKIKGEDICIEARIIAIADSFDAMTSDRPYRKALSKKEAIDEIIVNAGKQFDPDIAIIAANKIFKYM